MNPSMARTFSSRALTTVSMLTTVLSFLFLAPLAPASGAAGGTTAALRGGQWLHTYTLAQDGSPEAYDESMAVACLQGIINRPAPALYVLSRKNTRPQY